MITKFDIALVVPGMPFGPETVKTKSLGGSESAALFMANELAKLGNRVTVYNNVEVAAIDEETKVRYIPFGFWDSNGRLVPHDICIVQRAPELFHRRVNSRLNVLWCHDLPDPESFEKMKGVSWNIDKVMTLSNFMTSEYKRVYKLDDEEIFQTRNGLELSLFEDLPTQRDSKKLMYCARPERGLDMLLGKILPKLVARDPSLKFHVATYDNKVSHMAEFCAFCDSLASHFPDNIINLGALTKRELYEHYATARAYVYPTPSPIMPKFREVSCITAMECMAAGLPFVSSNNGALPETLAPGAGVLVDGDVTSDAYVDDFVNEVLRLVNDDAVFETMSQAGKKAASVLSWNTVAKDWMHKFSSTLLELNSDPYRLAKHFYRQSDIVAADAIFNNPELWNKAAPMHGMNMMELETKVDTDFGFYRTEDGMREQYEKIGATHDVRVIDWTPTEPRYQELKRYLLSRDEVNTIFDYGCAHGGYCVNLAKDIGRQWTGVDIDSHGISIASGYAKQCGVEDKVRLIRANVIKDELPTDIVAHDMVMLQEVLEHVKDPWEVLEKVEKYGKVGGTVYITVPYGPWEYESYFTYPHRCHIWHFDLHDIHDMVGHKQGLSINAMQFGRSKDLGDPLGWWIITYDIDHTPIGKIDLQRKLALQRPRQTVSAIMMGGGSSAEEQMHWTLRSLRDIADEIILADNGMSDEARRIAEQYPVQLIQGVDPKEFGFETPRNIGLDAATMDWALWIDLDERLINTPNIHKYLRNNSFNGYGIRQHHFACDTAFNPDMPVRLFRNKPYQGQHMRFFGMIHEHPELELNKGPGPVVVLSDVEIAHTGYLSEEIRQARFVRNYPGLQRDIEKYPERLLQKHFIMRDNMLLNRFELKMNGMRVTPEIRRRCEETIMLGEKYFLTSNQVMSSDSLEYYTEALSILGLGFEVAVSLDADRERAQPKGPKFVRFRNKESFIGWLSNHANAVIEPLTRSE